MPVDADWIGTEDDRVTVAEANAGGFGDTDQRATWVAHAAGSRQLDPCWPEVGEDVRGHQTNSSLVAGLMSVRVEAACQADLRTSHDRASAAAVVRPS